MNIKYKTWLILVLLVFGVSNETYAQENNAVSLNIETFLIFPKIGIVYERAINKYFSFDLCGNFGRNAIYVADSSFGIDVLIETEFLSHFCYYPFQTSIKRFFWDIGIGYKLVLSKTDDTKIYNLFPIQTRIGWKFGINKVFIQPWIGYNKDFGKEHYNEFFKYGRPLLGLSLGLFF